MDKLKPCPFCGGIARIYANDGVCVKCSKCGCLTPVYKDSGEWWENGRTNATENAIEAWNRRVSDA